MVINDVNLEVMATRRSQYPNENKPEFLLVGRSNVGKSSFINSILSRKNIAHTSATPGKTQTLNFYNVDDACPINLDRQEIAQQYYIVEDEVIYDAKFLETWDHVLVKNMNNEEWKIANFSYLQEENSKYKFICDNGKYNICIPWNAATKHLVGTKDTPIPIYNIKVE